MDLTQNEKEFFRDLGTRLRQARIERRQTQADLGARAGISRQLVAHMERGAASVSLEKWIQVSSALGLLDTWRQALEIPVDPFVEYDKRQQQLSKLSKTRVRKK